VDVQQFEAILRSLSTTPARRHLLRLFVGSTFGILAVETRPARADKGKKGGKGKKKKEKEKQSPGPCVPACKGKVCGPDSCGGSCGTCTGGTCRNGICDCTGDGPREFCGGECRNPCPAGRIRNPFTCACCIANNEDAGLCTPGLSNECCSQLCIFDSPSTCLGSNGVCQFDAQCASDVCLANGTCQV
jgi:hypothetical protein